MSKNENQTIASNIGRGPDINANINVAQSIQIQKWQRIAFASAVISLVSVIGLVYVSTRSTFIPYVVQVDEQTGYVKSLGSLEETSMKPTDSIKGYFLSRFIEGIRSIPADKKLLNENFNRTAHMFTEESANKYKELYLPTIKKNIEEGKRNYVKILSVTAVPDSKDSYSVRWQEETTSGGQGKPIVRAYSGVFTLKEERISDKELLVSNPMGLFVKDFQISDEGIVDEKASVSKEPTPQPTPQQQTNPQQNTQTQQSTTQQHQH